MKEVIGLFVIGGQQDFRTATHPEHLPVLIQSLLHKRFALLKYNLIDGRQK